MHTYSTREAAKKLGITGVALGRYTKTGKITPPELTIKVGSKNVHAWTDSDIKHVRKLLPKIANGRKTRYKKKHAAVSSQPKQRKGRSKKPKPTGTPGALRRSP